MPGISKVCLFEGQMTKWQGVCVCTHVCVSVGNAEALGPSILSECCAEEAALNRESGGDLGAFLTGLL